jgi:hypothetical protein
VFYEVLAGVVPFAGATLAGLLHAVQTAPVPPLGAAVPELPVDLAAVVHAALARDRADRFRDAGALLAAVLGCRSLRAAPWMAALCARYGRGPALAGDEADPTEVRAPAWLAEPAPPAVPAYTGDEAAGLHDLAAIIRRTEGGGDGG